ncbi:threonine ammonia-lyase [Benzoatithermus flavus]|uniref:Threonine ammonia-lyase n=1 Tax=Benzoatithermus flavus TaxID=3108223 RepID=A0ABU8Y049_9PROT
MTVTLEDVRAAAKRLEGQIVETPCLLSRTLSEMTGAEIWLKFENLQYTASFKERGAYNKLSRLTAEQRAAGVIAMSAGNHAQGVAYHARRLGIPATIVMPGQTPFVKVENTRRLGARVVLEGEGVEEAATRAAELGEQEGLTFIHPFDDPLVIAGQGTIALEMLAAAPDLDVLVVPIGGGGLIGGIATAAKTLKPEIEIVGVEAELYPSAYRRLRHRPSTVGGPTIAEGIAVKEPGGLTLPIIEHLVADVLLVEEAAIEAAIVQLLEIEKTVAEGAGAVGLAAINSHPERFRGRRVGLVISGGNIDSRLLSAVILRGLVRTQRLVRLRVSVPDSPGSLARIATTIANSGGNVVDVIHQRAFAKLSVKLADVDFTIETRTGEHAEEIARALVDAGFAVTRLGMDAGSGP